MRHMTILTGLVICLIRIISKWTLPPFPIGIVNSHISKFAEVTGCTKFTLAENRRACQTVVGGIIHAIGQDVGKGTNHKYSVIWTQKSERKNTRAIHKRKSILI